MATVWQPGMRITADRLNASSPVNWKTWTPDWSTTSGTGISTFGNAAIDCRYVQHGLLVQYSMRITFGSTTAFDTGTENWTFGLPVPAALSDAPIGYAGLYVGDTDVATSASAHLYDTGRFLLYILSGPTNGTAGAGGVVDNKSPFTWAAGHRLTVFGQYQPAS